MTQNDKDASKLRCQALAVIDLEAREVRPTDYYLVEKDGRVAFADGQHTSNPLGRVLFVIMPQRRDAFSAESFDV